MFASSVLFCFVTSLQMMSDSDSSQALFFCNSKVLLFLLPYFPILLSLHTNALNVLLSDFPVFSYIYVPWMLNSLCLFLSVSQKFQFLFFSLFVKCFLLFLFFLKVPRWSHVPSMVFLVITGRNISLLFQSSLPLIKIPCHIHIIA